MWVPPEDHDPVVFHEPTRRSIAVFGAVRASDGCMKSLLADTFNAESFRNFISELFRRRRRGKKMVVVVDNARWHYARTIRPWLESNRERLILDFLPPYSPELNSIERVWKLTRRLCTHNQYFGTLQELVERVLWKFEEWERPNETLRKLCAII